MGLIKPVEIESTGFKDIPNYHFEECARVSQLIENFKKSHPNNLIFGAVSDIHVYNGNTTYEEKSKTSAKHAAFALEMVGAMCGADFFANLGDNCWENGIDSNNAIRGGYYAMDTLQSARDRVTCYSLVGNHDTSESTGNTFDLIGWHNYFDVYSPTRNRGFGYTDYYEKKVRVIVLNTCDYMNIKGGCGMSYEQKDFLLRALDLSSKSDFAEWQILLLSHIPLDWNGGDYNFYGDLQTILTAYETGSAANITVNPSYAYNETPSEYNTYSNGKLVYDYTGKNAAKIIGNIHGHVHTNKVGTLLNTDILRMATVNANPDQNKTESYSNYGDYSITTTEAAKLKKVQGTAKDTACTFYCVDLDNFDVYSFGYGADVDRVVSYGVVNVEPEEPEVPDEPEVNYTNLFTSTDADFVDGAVLRSSGATKAGNGFVSGYIVAKLDDVIRVRCPNGTSYAAATAPPIFCMYDTSKTLISGFYSNQPEYITLDNDGLGFYVKIAKSACAYVRVSGQPTGAYSDFVVTKNEPIE